MDIYAETLGRLAEYLNFDRYADYICSVLDMSVDTIKKASKELPNAIKH